MTNIPKQNSNGKDRNGTGNQPKAGHESISSGARRNEKTRTTFLAIVAALAYSVAVLLGVVVFFFGTCAVILETM